MLFTIAIPTYNNANVLHKAIESAISQDFDEQYEILIVNNASKDNTLEIIKSYNDRRIHVINNPVTVTLYENHNVCLKEAKGDYVIFCHSDDELFCNALKVYKEKLVQRGYPQRYIVWGHSMCNDFAKKLRHNNQPLNEVFCGEPALVPFSMGGGLAPSGVCYSRKSIIKLGGFTYGTHKLHEGDWVILVLAALDCFEFEMIDRLILKRTAASTATDRISLQNWLEARKETLSILFKSLGPQKSKLFLNAFFINTDITYYPVIKEYLSKKEKILFLLRRISLKSFILRPVFCIKIIFRNV